MTESPISIAAVETSPRVAASLSVVGSRGKSSGTGCTNDAPRGNGGGLRTSSFHRYQRPKVTARKEGIEPCTDADERGNGAAPLGTHLHLGEARPRSEPAYGFIFSEKGPASGRRIASYTASQCCEISVMARAVARAAASRRAFTFSTSSRRFSIASRRVRYPLTSRAMMSTSVTPESYAGESRAGSRFANRFAKPSKGSSSDRSLSHSSLVPKWCTARLAAPAAPVAFWWKHDKGSSVVTAAGQTSLRAEELALDGERSRHRSIPVVWELAEEGRVDAQLGGAGD